MKKWSEQEIAALSNSVATHGYSKGIRAFINSEENNCGRTFSACEYMLYKQAKQHQVDDATVPVDEKPQMHKVDDDTKHEMSWIKSLIYRLFGCKS